VRALIALALAAACGGQAHPASPPFDAGKLAAAIDGVMADIEVASRDYDRDCPRAVHAIEQIEARAAEPIGALHAAERDRERAAELAQAMHGYDTAAAGRSEVIAMRLAICWKRHGELHDQLQHVVDSLPTP